MALQKIKTTKIESWNRARRLKLIRSSPCGVYKNIVLDRGVNYFILALERIGCKTYYSCEGHFRRKNFVPEFYIFFHAGPKAIKLIKSMLTKYTNIEKYIYQNEYTIRIFFKNPNDKISKLNRLSKKWNKKLGPIEVISNINIA